MTRVCRYVYRNAVIPGLRMAGRAGRYTNDNIIKPLGREYLRNWRFAAPATVGLALGALVGSYMDDLPNADYWWILPANMTIGAGVIGSAGFSRLNRYFPRD